MIYFEIFKLIARYFKRNKKIVILEIGVGRKAYSTKAFLQGLALRKFDSFGKSSGRLFSIDDNKRSDGEKRNVEILPGEMAKLMNIDKDWTFIEGDSKKVEWSDKVDVLFIDGDHSYEGARADFEKYEPFVKRDGLILMHDVLPRQFGVRKFWEEIKYPKVKLPLDRPGLGFVRKI